MSLNNSIFSRPAGVSPMLISINTTGLAGLDDILRQDLLARLMTRKNLKGFVGN